MKKNSIGLLPLFNRLDLNYRDSLGRVTYLPAVRSNWLTGNYDSLNQHLWTGEALLLWDLCYDLDDHFRTEWIRALRDIFKKTTIFPGLISRHPFPYNQSPSFDEISLDEYFGACCSCVVMDLKDQARDMLKYHEDHGWHVSDAPQLIGKKVSDYVFTFGFWKTIGRSLAYVFKTWDFTGSNELDAILAQNEGVDLLTSYRMPKDRLFLKLAAGGSGSLVDVFHFYLSAMLTLKVSNDETSGRILLLFKLLLLQKLGHPQTSLAKYYKKKMTAKYGRFYLHECFKKYYEDPKHPFIQIVKYIDVSDDGQVIPLDPLKVDLELASEKVTTDLTRAMLYGH